ncbi:MAG TPA: tRNA pseudouridine(38-40) synthase TruA [Bryobacteraceae bacterium]|nr:tRNA pseudouridine(38-40) synthase TruA [Bryobacteraceae bacterium]
MSTWKLVIEYDGTRYSGWQDQKNARTVAGEIRAAAEEYFRSEVDLHGAGRTDAGVHALAQVAHLRLPGKQVRRPKEILRELNSRLPADIVIIEAEEAPGRFHARHDALSRAYRYQISTRKTAFSKRFVWWVKEDLDVPLMARAAKMFEGRHDFICFRAEDAARPDESTIVVVRSASIEVEDPLLVFRIEASHFLWRMVRRLAGVLVKLGLHEITEADFARLIEGRCDRRLDVAAWTAPSSGLLLERVTYPEGLIRASKRPLARFRK